MTIKNYAAITSLEELQRYVDKIISDNIPFGFDIETGYYGPDRKKGSLRVETHVLVGISFTNSLEWARYVPLNHQMAENLPLREALEILRPLLLTGLGVPHNASFELRALSRAYREQFPDNEEIRSSRGYFPVKSDTLIEAYVKADFIGTQLGLKSLVFSLFNHKMMEIEELFTHLPKNKMSSLRFNELDLTQKVIDYACEDSLWALAVHHHYYPLVKNNFIYKLDMATMRVVCEMEDFGIKFDWVLMRDALARAEDFRSRLDAEIQEDLSKLLGIGVNINLGSPAQLQDILYNKLGLSTTVMTKGGVDGSNKKMSASDKALTGLAKQFPVVQRIQDWKGIQKLMTSYLLTYERDFGDAPDGMVHPSYNHSFVVTGRFSAASPNVQQLPKKYHYDLREAAEVHAAHEAAHGKKCACDEFEPPPGTCFKFNFRDVVTVPEGFYFLGYDLSQAELRAIAGEANEPFLLKAFEKGEDVHTLTASLVLGKPAEEITPQDRSIGKTAQPLDSRVLTPLGWRRFGDLQIGDFVIGGSGKPVRVTDVIPKGRAEVYAITTTDGAVAESCADHFWTVRNCSNRSKEWKTYQLSKILKRPITQADGTLKWRLPDRPVVDYGAKSVLPIDPYVLGALLGDGSFRHDWGVMFGSADMELLDTVREAHESMGGKTTSLDETSSGFWRFYLVSGVKGAPNKMTRALKELGVWGHKSDTKFIPSVYMTSSPHDRLAVLQGLLDTDGNVQASGALFRSTSRQLAEGVMELARSLGGFAYIKHRKKERSGFTLGEGSCLPHYEVYLRLPQEFEPFRLKRKIASRQEVKYGFRVSIKSIEAVGEKDVQCITVDAEDGLYVTEGNIITHNCNFALLYGQGRKSFGEMLGVSQEEGEKLYDKYFEAYSAIAAYKDKQERYARKNLHVWTKFGRKCSIFEYLDSRRWIQSAGDRNALNYPIQGAATGDFVRIGMVRARKKIREVGLEDKIHLVLNVHDSLDFYVHRSLSPKFVIDLLKNEVIFPVPGWPPMIADWRIGTRWGSTKDLVIHPDGSVQIKNGPFISEATEEMASPEVEPQEEISVLEETSQEVPRETDYAASSESKHLIIELAEMPDTEQIAAFSLLLKNNPGHNVVELRTPEGNTELARTTKLDISDQTRISLALGGAKVFYPVEDIDAASVFAGMTL